MEVDRIKQKLKGISEKMELGLYKNNWSVVYVSMEKKEKEVEADPRREKAE